MLRNDIRLKAFDYRSPGIYLVTLVTDRRARSLATISRDGVSLLPWGRVVEHHLALLPAWRPNVEILGHIVMPDHVHVILQFCEEIGAGLGGVVNCLKGGITREINLLRRTDGAVFWQRNYWERVLRSEADLERCRHYLTDNPRRWREKYGVG